MSTATIPINTTIGPMTVGVGTTVVGTPAVDGMQAFHVALDLAALVTPVTLRVEYAADGLTFRDMGGAVYAAGGTSGLEISFGNDAAGNALTAPTGAKVRLSLTTATAFLSTGGAAGTT